MYERAVVSCKMACSGMANSRDFTLALALTLTLTPTLTLTLQLTARFAAVAAAGLPNGAPGRAYHLGHGAQPSALTAPSAARSSSW